MYIYIYIYMYIYMYSYKYIYIYTHTERGRDILIIHLYKDNSLQALLSFNVNITVRNSLQAQP